MITVATGKARKTKVSPQGSNCKSDQFGRFSPEVVQAVLAADARVRNAARKAWRDYFTLPGGRVLYNLAEACWLLTTTHGEAIEDGDGKPLGVRVTEDAYQIGVSQIATLAGVGIRAIQLEVESFFKVTPRILGDSVGHFVQLAGAVPEVRQGQFLVRMMGEGANEISSRLREIISSSCEISSRTAKFFRLSVPGEGVGTVYLSSPEPKPLPSPNPLSSQEGAEAPRGGVGGGAQEPGKILTAQQEAVKAALLAKTAKSRLKEARATEAVLTCPSLVLGALAVPSVMEEAWQQVLADKTAKCPPLLFLARVREAREGDRGIGDLAVAYHKRQEQRQIAARRGQEAPRPAFRVPQSFLASEDDRRLIVDLKEALARWIAAQASAYEVANAARLERRSTTPEEKLLVQEASRTTALVKEALRKTGPIEVPGGVARHDDMTQWRALLTVLEGMDLDAAQECPVAAPQSPEALVSTAAGAWVAASLLDALEAHFQTGTEDGVEVLSRWLAEAGPLAVDGRLVQIEDEAALRSLEACLRKLLAEKEAA